MRIWKQLLISVVVIAAGFILWLKFVPGADKMFVRAGVPQSLVLRIVPQAETDKGNALAGAGQKGSGGRRFGAFGGAVTVVTSPTGEAVANDRLVAIGNGAAIRSVSVTPDEAGKLSEIKVRAGDKVMEGDIIGRLDNREQIIAVEKAKLDLKAAQEKLERYENLKGNLSRVELADAQSATETARLAVDAAKLSLEQRDIKAPISGLAGIVDVELGDNLTSTTTVVTIDDRSAILVEFWAPERFTDTISAAMPVSATAIARPGKEYVGTVEAVDSRVDEASRTFRVRARIPNDNDELRAGMSFKVTLELEGQTYPAIDPLSVQWDSKGSYVWKVVDGKATRAAIRIIQRNPENVLVEGEVKKGDLLVVEGIQRLREGSDVKEQGEPPKDGERRQTGSGKESS